MLGQRAAWAFGATARLPTHCGVLQGSKVYTFGRSIVTSKALPPGLQNANVSCCKQNIVAQASAGEWHVAGVGSQTRFLGSRVARDSPRTAPQGKNDTKTTELVKQLRELTSVSVGLCKQALEASNWDLEESVRYLRKAGIARAAKTALREAHEGVVSICSVNDGTSWGAVILNCETDFVQRSPKFVAFAKALARHLLALPSVQQESSATAVRATDILKDSKPSTELSSLTQNEGKEEFDTVKDLFAILTSQFGEKIDITAAERLDSSESSCIGAYVHNEVEAGVGRVAALVEISYDSTESSKKTALLHRRLLDLARLLAMQAVATRPKFLSLGSIPSSFVQQERALVEQAAAKRTSSAPARGSTNVDLSKANEKELYRILGEQTLLEQEFLMLTQFKRDILGDENRTADASVPARPDQYFTVAEALKLVERGMGCKLEVSRMKLLIV